MDQQWRNPFQLIFSPPFFFVEKHFSKLRKKFNDDEEGTEMGKDVSGECDLTRSLALSLPFFAFSSGQGENRLAMGLPAQGKLLQQDLSLIINQLIKY